MERWSKKLEVKRNGLSNSITMLRGPLKGRGLFAKSPLLPSTKNILKKKTKGPSMKASWLIIFFYWNGKWPWQCSGLHNALKGITMAKMQTWQKIPTLPVVLMILKTLLQMNAAGEKILILPNHRIFSFKNSFRRLWHINTKCWTTEHKSNKQPSEVNIGMQLSIYSGKLNRHRLNI